MYFAGLDLSVFFTVIAAIYSLIVMIIYVDDDQVLLDASRLLLFFVASVLFSCANGLFKLKKLNGALRIIIHYLLTLFAFYSCMMLPISPDTSAMFVGLALFSVLYFIVTGLIALFKARYRSRFEEKSAYSSQFSKK